MATSTDRTAFRTITEDGETVDQTEFPMPGRTLESFEQYVAVTVLDDGETAQWFVYDGEGELLAECNASGDVTTYPAADLFS